MKKSVFRPNKQKSLLVYSVVYGAIIPGFLNSTTTLATEYAAPASGIIVTATRLESETEQLPANITVITAADIQSSPAKTLPEILGLEAGVTSRSLFGNSAARSTVDMRGFGAAAAQNTLILLDGRRLSDIDLSPVNFSAIPLNNIERIEIIRGGSVLYGDGATGGSINIITKGVKKDQQQADVKLTLGSYDSQQLEASIQRAKGPFSTNLSANILRSDGYRDHNDMRQQNLQGDLHMQQDNGELFLEFGLDKQELELPGTRRVNPPTNQDQLSTDREGASTPDDYANQDGYFVTAGVSRFIKDNAELIVDVGYRHKNQQAFFAWGSYIDTELNTWSVTPRLKMELDAGIAQTLTTGLDYYDSGYTSYRSQQPGVAFKHRYKATQRNLALYVHDLVHLSDDTLLTAGARLQRVELNATDLYDASAPGFAGSQATPLDTADNEHILELGIKHQLNNHISVFGKLERSVRVTTLDETLNGGTFSALKPQTATHADLGILTEQDNYSLQASLYHMRLRNEIHYDSGTFNNVNLDPTRRYGIELSGNTAIRDDLSIKVNYAYTRAKFREGSYAGNEVPVVPKHTASISALWKVTADTNASASASYIGEKYFDNDQQNNFYTKIPAYTSVDLKLNKRWSEWQLEGTVNNLLDEKAFDYGVRGSTAYTAYPLPERNFSLSLSKRF